MDREAILKRLRAHREPLHRKGVTSVALFGSIARGQASDASDIDLAVTLDRRFSSGGLDYFAKLDALESELAELLGHPVDVVAMPVRAPHLRTAIEKDKLIAFE